MAKCQTMLTPVGLDIIKALQRFSEIRIDLVNFRNIFVDEKVASAVVEMAQPKRLGYRQ